MSSIKRAYTYTCKICRRIIRHPVADTRGRKSEYCPECLRKRWPITRETRIRYEAKRHFRMMIDPEFYANERRKGRRKGRVFREKRMIEEGKTRKRNGGEYKARLSVRIPDYSTFRRVRIDPNSIFLPENATPSHIAYAKELAIERRRKGH